MIKNKVVLVLLILFSFVVACSDDEAVPSRMSSIARADLKGEGDKILIDFTTNNWYILFVSTVDSDLGFYEEYDSSNQWETIIGDWFVLRKISDKQIEVEVKENFEDNSRNLWIAIESSVVEGDVEGIDLRQFQTSNYQIKTIQFSAIPIEKSFFEKEVSGISHITINGGSSEFQTSYYPLLNEQETSLFESTDSEAFSWMKSDFVFEVEVPMEDLPSEATDILTKREYINDITYVVTRYARNNPFRMDVPVGKKVTAKLIRTKCYKEIYNYTLTIINKKTLNEKQVKGQWTIEVPYDYVVDVKIEDLEEGDL